MNRNPSDVRAHLRHRREGHRLENARWMHQKALRAGTNLLGWINVICPVQTCLKKYFTSPVGQIISTHQRHPTPQRGVS
jgi:hypothetical protein